jgi:outer membrane biogenesis lipoprotein LolB
MRVFVIQLPQQDQNARCETENGEQRYAENLEQLPSNLFEPPLTAFVEGDHL